MGGVLLLLLYFSCCDCKYALFVKFYNCGVLICFQLTIIWKLMEKQSKSATKIVPTPTSKQSKSATAERQSASQGLKWSFSAGTNLLSRLGAKIESQSKQKLNEFAREPRSFSYTDMSGMLARLIYEKCVYGCLICF